MFISIRLLKELNFTKKKYILIYKRSQNITKKRFSKKNIFIHRGLYAVRYKNNQYLHYLKFGMFALTRKPFAKPIKKNKIKKR